MMLRRYQSGKRGKAATAFTAALRLTYSRKILYLPGLSDHSHGQDVVLDDTGGAEGKER
jgi:hypothetical protein